MLVVPIKPNLITKAEQEARKLKILKNSVLEGKGNMIGVLGELIVAEEIEATIANTFDYDLIKDNVKIDVKTNSSICTPKENYDCTIWGYNPNQQCDCYIFVRILKTLETAYLVGWIKKKEFFDKATFYAKGALDPKSNVNHKFRGDCFQLEISKLNRFKKDR